MFKKVSRPTMSISPPKYWQVRVGGVFWRICGWVGVWKAEASFDLEEVARVKTRKVDTTAENSYFYLVEKGICFKTWWLRCAVLKLLEAVDDCGCLGQFPEYQNGNNIIVHPGKADSHYLTITAAMMLMIR